MSDQFAHNADILLRGECTDFSKAVQDWNFFGRKTFIIQKHWAEEIDKEGRMRDRRLLRLASFIVAFGEDWLIDAAVDAGKPLRAFVRGS